MTTQVESATPFNNTLGPERLLDFLFPDPQGGFVRLIALDNETFLRREGGGVWRWPGDASRTMQAFITATGSDCRFNPILTTSPVPHAPLLDVGVVWASVTLPIVAAQKGWPKDGVRPGDRDRALAGFTGVRPEPNVILYAGSEVAALWLLCHGLAADDPRLEKARRYLAAQVGGDLGIAVGDVRRITFPLPQVRSSTVYPAFTTMAFPYSDTRYPIERFLEPNGGGRS